MNTHMRAAFSRSKMSKISEGRKFREKLSLRCQPDEIRSPSSSPKDDEGGDTESVDSSDEAVSCLSQSFKRKFTAKENEQARQKRPTVLFITEPSPSRNVSGW